MNGVVDEQQEGLRPAPATRSQHQHQSHPNHHQYLQQHQQQLTPSSSSRRHQGSETTHFDIKQHPAAIAYAAAHPNRTIPKFGPYILLQTLGEGEFGKVKLGLHTHWAEEVAVKLIRRGSVENDVRMQKIRREIAVLESLHHPNIVRLYETIETDKYIGIILDYASGGELFDHILAHRYLREKDARKLFAQLISAVWYIHQKKIVHRDLKLENLLLDRNRNIIVTDFGFANRFEHRTDDLMQTSCGSPCYAAPELVISEGSYVGSAVDIWSCGVILYAMLAGYLPFDDDPENPEGDNIQQLYRYILNTPLTFPEHVSEEARDLLHKMLVPDPTQRSTLKTVMEHPWLAPHADLFILTVDDAERLSKEMQESKKHQYRRQMREREKDLARQARAQAQRREHHQTHVIEPSTSSRDARSAADRLHDPMSAQANVGHERTGRRAVASAIVMSSPPEDDTPLAVATAEELRYEPTGAAPLVPNMMMPDAMGMPSHEARDRKTSTRSKKGQTIKTPTADSGTNAMPLSDTTNTGNGSAAPSAQKSSRKAGGFRHTIQLEYDDGAEVEPAPPTPPRPSSRSTRQAATELPLETNFPTEGDMSFSPATMSEPVKQSPTKARRSSTTSRPQVPIPAVPALPPSAMGRRGSNASPILLRNPATDPGPMLENGRYDANEIAGIASPVSSPPVGEPAQPDAVSETQKPSKKQSQDKSRPGSSSGRRHTRGISIDRIVGFGKMITGGGSGKDTDPNSVATSPTVSKQASGVGKRASSKVGKKGGDVNPPLPTEHPMDSNTSITPSSTTLDAASSTAGGNVTPTTPGGSTHADVSMSESTSGSVKSASKRRGGKALSLMVDPITKMKDRSKHRASVQAGLDLLPSKEEKADKKAKDISGPLSAHAVAQDHPEVPPTDQKTELAATAEKEKNGHQTANTQGWRIPLFRDTSVRGTSRNPPAATAQRQQNPAPVAPPAVPPQNHNINSYDTSMAMAGMTPTGATTKSQGVMDWFRKKSLAKERKRAGSTAEPPPPNPLGRQYDHAETIDLEAEQDREAAKERDAAGDRAKTPTQSTASGEAKTPTKGSFKKGRDGKNPPSVIVTSAAEPMHIAEASGSTPSRMDRVVGAIKNVTHVPPSVHVPVNLSTKRVNGGASSAASFGGSSSGGSYSKVVIRLHEGPVDPSTLSSAPPQEIITQVLEVLKGMGIEYSKESEFKYRCVRPKKKKPTGVGREPSGSGMAASSSGNGLDKRGLPSSGNMLKYIMRRSSSQAPPRPDFNHAPIAFDEEALDLGTPPLDTPAGETVIPKVEPIYGDKPDQHDEVRFSVEVTKIDRLEDLLSLDIRRLKGNLKSYKFLYDIIRERCNLQR
ncbi:hypothetical protein FRB91_001195 [Serendipita sp. 411]|nr:hypothetical protein FRB91_001195 [Serendipita sp. 411]